ncbi:fumarylacetoacetate hydrolase family protein [Microbaculum sp. FT89]|uniref:fumarylacetoacetate hydrolase family protein n=1 Tax=Microbaculum sp. FT89 TaxID=3447298 RepID=UPI003F5352BA
MKLVTFQADDTIRIGVVRHEGIVALDDSRPAFRSMRALLEAGPKALEAARAAGERETDLVVLSDVRLLAPLPRPAQMRDALVFEKHLRQARANRYIFGLAPERVSPDEIAVPSVWYEQPIYYKCNRFAVSGPEDEIRWPKGETRLDYELEIAAVIGTGGRDISRADAKKHIAGYMIFNDFSARDFQFSEIQAGLGPAKGKDFDTANALGPWLVTPDEVDPADGLEMTARVNGEVWSRGRSDEMQHDFARIVEHVSKNETLHPGEVIGSGTVGNGCGLEHGRFLSAGDVVELEIEGLGLLRNRIGRMA